MAQQLRDELIQVVDQSFERLFRSYGIRDSVVTSSFSIARALNAAAQLVDASSYGAIGDGVANDTPALQKALDDLKRKGGGVLYLPAGTYKIYPQDVGINALTIDSDNITIMGDGHDKTIISCYVSRGRNPVTNYDIVNAAVWRGSAFGVTSVPGGTRQHVSFVNLRITGNAPRRNDLYPKDGNVAPLFPASVVDGTGWDLTHHPIKLDETGTFDNIRVTNCEIDSFYGELLQGADFTGKYEIRNCVLHDCNGSIVSMNADMILDSCKIYNGLQGVENSHFAHNQTVTNNEVYDCSHGLTWPANVVGAPGWGTVVCEGNFIHDCPKAGVFISGWEQNIIVRGNTIVDCASVVEWGMIRVDDQYGGTPQNIVIENNALVADTVSPFAAFYCSLTQPCNVVFRRNHLKQTTNAAANARAINQTVHYALAGNAVVRIEDNDFSGGLYLPATPSNTPNLPVFKNNYIDTLNIFNSVRNIEVAPDNTAAIINSPILAFIHNHTGTYVHVPGLQTTGVPDKSILDIVEYSGQYPTYIDGSTTGVLVRGPRYIHAQSTLRLQFDAALSKWVEVDYKVSRSNGATTIDLTGEQMWLATETSDNLAPNIEVRGQKKVTLAPTVAKTYSNVNGIVPDQLTTICVNSNSTIAGSATLKLQGASFAPTSGGFMVVMKPSGSSVTYEVSRVSY
jgi:hypothetical protein